MAPPFSDLIATTMGNAINETVEFATTTAPSIVSTTVRRVVVDQHLDFGWKEQGDDGLSRRLPPMTFPRFHHFKNYNQRAHITSLIPFGAMLVISTIIFILIIFRRWPGVISGIIAGSLTFITIYLLLLTLKEEVLVYE